MPTTDFDINTPPRTIWDPPVNNSNESSGMDDDDEEDEDIDPMKWSNQAMRIQLWDTFRLARIILGEPIKTRRLTSHLILHAIRKVAEMKLLISMLQKQMNDKFFEARAAAEESSMRAIEAAAPKIPSPLETVPESSESESSMSPHLETPTSSRDGRHFHYASSDEEDLEEIFNETSEDLQRYGCASAAIKSKPSVETTNTPTTWDSSVDSEGVVHHVTSEDDSYHVAVLRREILSQPTLEHSAVSSGLDPRTTLESKPSAKEYNKLLRMQSQKQHQEIESMLKSLDLKVQETSNLTSSQIKALQAKLDDARCQQEAVLKQQEQRLQRLNPRPTPAEAKTVRMAKQQSKRHQQEMDAMLQQLYDKVRETSEHTSEQIQELYHVLQHAKMQQETAHAASLDNLRRQMEDQEQTQKEHFDAIVLKHFQTQEALEEQLAHTQERLQEQVHVADDWQRKYQQLESSIVSKKEAQAVLKKVQALNAQLYVDRTGKGKPKKITMTRSEISRVNQSVIELLSKMVETNNIASDPLLTRPLQMELPAELKQAKEKEAAILEELDFLKLQKDMLLEDTSKKTPEQLEEMRAAATQQFKKELADILVAEGHRLQEIEHLETELNHLAYLAVQIEECEHDFRKQQELYQQSIQELRAQNHSSTAKLRTLQGGIQETVEQQAVKLVRDKGDASLSAGDLRIRELEQALVHRDAELANSQAQLNASQERVRRLEAAIASQ
ncbi:hypothetical protein IV203_022475 [Nitzschia inconspicua]|uniref:Uncharacterized protein n=1 Tax=Nitzschia inconspicua TaxID=303405 RepID=A0A9K3KIX8_9STRA|nr:hypothetical protein IV203_022742 [Nitzschia inconspicua]KAG7344467.1 hypothetical protein IV203_022475 [Nitzschia inconspicua]